MMNTVKKELKNKKKFIDSDDDWQNEDVKPSKSKDLKKRFLDEDDDEYSEEEFKVKQKEHKNKNLKAQQKEYKIPQRPKIEQKVKVEPKVKVESEADNQVSDRLMKKIREAERREKRLREEEQQREEEAEEDASRAKARQQKKKVVKKVKKKRKNKEKEVDVSVGESPKKKVKYSRVQCQGPQCVYPARVNSKYCSKECGLKLARMRLDAYMPQQISDWMENKPVAEQIYTDKLKMVQGKIETSKQELLKLEQKFRQLEEIIAKCKKVPIELVNKKDKKKHNKSESDQNIICPVCAQSISIKMAAKHFDRCYTKTEALVSYGSVYPALRAEKSDRLYCNYRNEQQNTYCRRLQVMCAEHTKERRALDKEVCGFPLNRNNLYDENFVFTSKNCCTSPKNTCNKHYKWETLMRASIDILRIRQSVKLEEIMEEERTLKQQLSSMTSLVALLCHKTIRHSSEVDLRSGIVEVEQKPTYRFII